MNEPLDPFLLLICHLKKPSQAKEFLELFFTHEERAQIASRLIIIKALLEGKLTQRQIAEKFKVSIAQITRGSNALKIASPELLQFLTEN